MSQDILFITLSICSIALTVYVCRTLYYLIQILKDINKTLDWFQKTLSNIDTLLSFIKDKLDNATSYLASLIDLARIGIGLYKDVKQNRPIGKKKD